MSEQTIGVLILAAGASARMGEPKQLMPWGEVTLLENAIIQAATSDADAVVVVLGANADNIKKTIPEHVPFVENPYWITGMGSSIACGMQFFLNSKTIYSAVLVMLCDQPLIDADYINQILLAMRKEKKGIIATDYKGRAGVPALFSANYFSQLAALNSEFGAKQLLAENVGAIHRLKAGAKTIDIDTKEEYKKLNKLNT